MTIVGLGGLPNNAACAVSKGQELVAAIEQKKLRRNLTNGLPDAAIAACLSIARVAEADVDCVAIVRPLGPETALHLALRDKFPNARIVVVEHHTAHAASAYYASPFESATVLTLDNQGDFRCGARWTADGNTMQIERELYYPDSLGDLYGRVTELIGYEPSAEEHKVQWMSTAGDSRFVELFEEIMGVDSSGWPRLDRSFFEGDRLRSGGFSHKFYQRSGLKDREPVPAKLQPALAAGLQRALERTVIRMAGKSDNLCVAGGVHFNALLIAALENSGHFKNVFAQPAAGNTGTAIGALLYAWHNVYQRADRVSIGNLCLGPAFTAEEIKKVLENCKLRFRYLLTSDELVETAVRELEEDKIVAWMHGRMEFGPRALGNRSILAAPRSPYSSENLNVYIKHREPSRKFAASVPAELAAEYFEVGTNARFLATVGRVREAYRKTFASAILGDDLVRVHTVEERDNPLYHRLLHATGAASGLPVLYNTSFNLFSDPLVCTPRDAVRSFYSSGIDSMFVGNFLLQK